MSVVYGTSGTPNNTVGGAQGVLSSLGSSASSLGSSIFTDFVNSNLINGVASGFGYVIDWAAPATVLGLVQNQRVQVQ